jgi:hypothetical protein
MFEVRTKAGTVSKHACYSPALAEAKKLPDGYVMAVAVRGMATQVWPLPPLDMSVFTNGT